MREKRKNRTIKPPRVVIVIGQFWRALDLLKVRQSKVSPTSQFNAARDRIAIGGLTVFFF